MHALFAEVLRYGFGLLPPNAAKGCCCAPQRPSLTPAAD
jgi:hypothetical protein